MNLIKGQQSENPGKHFSFVLLNLLCAAKPECRHHNAEKVLPREISLENC